tara:strand:+ start:441 stop:836 length:396 start_codon:yes stop_codon:yes gene_type:complete
MKKFLPIIFYLFSSTLSAQECVNYEEFKSTFKVAGAVYGAVGALKSNSCNDSIFAEKKRKLFFEEILTPGMIEDVNKGKYPKKCTFVLTDMINQFHDETQKMSLTPSLCQDAKSLLEILMDMNKKHSVTVE